MKRLILIAIVASTALSLPVMATTVVFSSNVVAANVRDVVLNDGATAVGQSGATLVLAGMFSSVGSFTYNPALTVLANVNNMVSMGGFAPLGFVPGSYSSGAWTPEWTTDSLQVNYNSGTGLSQASGTITDNTTNASVFNGSQVYLVIFNGTTVSASTQMGIFTGMEISPSMTWSFPSNTQGNGDSTTYSTATPNNNVSPAASAGSVNSSPNQLELAATPEPSALLSLLGGSGLLALLRRRRLA